MWAKCRRATAAAPACRSGDGGDKRPRGDSAYLCETPAAAAAYYAR